MLTLAHYPSPTEHVTIAHREMGRPTTAKEVSRIVDAMAEARHLPEVRAAQAIEDTSTAAHHRSEHLLYQSAGIDTDLAEQMYRLLGSPSFHEPYPDALPVLRDLHSTGTSIGVVSDIHVDLRSHADQFGFGDLIDAWALSFELGIQKPDLRIFQAALDHLEADPATTLMVGDRPSRDGAAAQLGMTCLILPPPTGAAPRGLDAAVALASP